VVFDVVGIDPPVANALRRIMIAKVPTMALEQITILQNTSEVRNLLFFFIFFLFFF
jgi:DNA-directed RNA polymerase I and III subunit RPAC1